jgi:hypothetical protein
MSQDWLLVDGTQSLLGQVVRVRGGPHPGARVHVARVWKKETLLERKKTVFLEQRRKLSNNQVCYVVCHGMVQRDSHKVHHFRKGIYV